MAERIRWKGPVIEGIVIVGSILLAFGIDAWWDSRHEASRRAAVIEGLRSDFATAREDLDRVAAFHLEGRASAERLVGLGCGSGRFAGTVTSKAWTVVATDRPDSLLTRQSGAEGIGRGSRIHAGDGRLRGGSLTARGSAREDSACHREEGLM